MAKDVSVKNLPEIQDQSVTTGKLLIYRDDQLKKVEVSKIVSEITSALSGLVTEITTDNTDNTHFPSVKAAVDYVASKLTELKNDILGEGVTSAYDTLKEVEDYIKQHGSDYAALIEDLNDKVSSDDLEETLGDYVKSDDLDTTLEDYVKEDALTSALEDYLKSEDLDSKLEDYLEDNNYVTTEDLTSALEDYLQESDLTDYVKEEDLETKLDDYVLKTEYNSLKNKVEQLEAKLNKLPSLDGLSSGVLYGLLGGTTNTWEQICADGESVFTVPTPA